MTTTSRTDCKHPYVQWDVNGKATCMVCFVSLPQYDSEPAVAAQSASCEPPDHNKGFNYHWLKRADREGAVVVRWMQSSNSWLFEGNPKPYSCADLGVQGYEYLGPAIPPGKGGVKGLLAALYSMAKTKERFQFMIDARVLLEHYVGRNNT